MNNESIIALIKASCIAYPKKESIFRPSIDYPELINLGGARDSIGEYNAVYDAVREGLHILGYDSEHYGTVSWNPLGSFIKPGDKVLIKPNLVMHRNHIVDEGNDCLYTHPSVVAPIIDYIIIALKGKGQIIIGDAPMQECNWHMLIDNSGYRRMVEYYENLGIDIQLVDFRELTSIVKNGIHYQTINKNSKGRVINLGKESEFAKSSAEEIRRMRVTNYDPRIMQQHHNEKVHEYYVSQYVLDADVIINMPKPKTHRKAGVTISLKNLVGINTRKEYLPHHRMGEKGVNGDEYLQKSNIHKFRSILSDKKCMCEYENQHFLAYFLGWIILLCSIILKLQGTPYSEGSWYGNDTISRTILDLNKIVLYADKEGKLNSVPQRKIMVVADMIISGHKEGPVRPSRKEVGFIGIGTNCVCVDEAISTFMGLDFNKIPTVKRARHVCGCYKLVDDGITPKIVSNLKGLNNIINLNIPDSFMQHFEPSSGWKNHIEL